MQRVDHCVSIVQLQQHFMLISVGLHLHNNSHAMDVNVQRVLPRTHNVQRGFGRTRIIDISVAMMSLEPASV